jgi:hypothetical protein
MKTFAKILICTFSLGLISPCLFAQDNSNGGFNPTSLVVQNVQELNTLLNKYTEPMLGTFGNNLGQGWYNTADPLKTGRFELKIVASASFVPAKLQTFNLRDLNLTSFKPSSGQGDLFPTVLGKEADSAKMDIIIGGSGNNQLKQSLTLKALPLPIQAMPFATPQLSIGITKGTELMVRFCPNLSFTVDKDKGQKLSLKYFGVGIKHDLKQWIPVLKVVPFSLSAFGSYSKVNANVGGGAFLTANDVEDNYNLMVTPTPDPSAPDFTKQKISLASNNWNVGGVISKKLSVLTLFGGVSLSGYSTSIKLEGGYPVLTAESTTTQASMTHVIDPINLSVNHTQISATGGFRLKLLIMNLSVYGNYVPGGYSSVSASVGFGYFN